MLKGEVSSQKASPYNVQPVDPNTIVGEKFLSKRYRDLIGYLILFHYYPIEETHFCYLYIDLQDHIKEIPESFWLSVLLENKELFLKWLVKQQTMTEGEFFGSIANENNLNYLMSKIVIQFEEKLRRPRKVIRRKGYKDKGSRANDSTLAIRQEESIDIYLTLNQLRIEEQREIRSLKLILFREYLDEDRKLSDEDLVTFKILKSKGEKANESKRNSKRENPEESGNVNVS
jgi:hypothetical protein